MTSSVQRRRGAGARAERRLLVQLSVAAVSMVTLAVSWLGIAGTERPAVAQPAELQTASMTDSGTLTTIVPAPASSRANVVRRSRAS